jgi:hypothetical protein
MLLYWYCGMFCTKRTPPRDQFLSVREHQSGTHVCTGILKLKIQTQKWTTTSVYTLLSYLRLSSALYTEPVDLP